MAVPYEEKAKRAIPVTEELDIQPIYEHDRPEVTDYHVDVLVVGGGLAGINAAYTAKKAGKNVLLIDKGRPGYSGMSPWVGCTAHFDAERGDSEEQLMLISKIGGENISDSCWMKCWIDESKAIYERLQNWGMLDQYPRSADDGYWDNFDVIGYHKKYLQHDRHRKFVEVLDKNEIPYLQHVMITNLVVEDGVCVGAIGFQVTTGAYISVSAKAVILCTGNGSVMPQGFPMGGNTFDGEYMAYQAGLPITGKEFEDYHGSQTYAAGSAFNLACWTYLENIWITGGGTQGTKYDGKNAERFIKMQAGQKMKLAQLGDEGLQFVSNPEKVHPKAIDHTVGIAGSENYGKDPLEIRSGKLGSGSVKDANATGAPGACLHMCSGVFSGFNNTDCSTELPGLYVAGDGTHASGWQGGNYFSFNGMTSGFVSIDGNHAAAAACKYCDTVPEKVISKKSYNRIRDEIDEPLKLEKGFDPSWARDILLAIMAPYWMVFNKREDTLKAALVQVEYMRDNVVPKLIARTPHDLRLCHEMRHKILACELKLRASIFRKESRGMHFREDYPYRNDEKYLGWVMNRKGADGKAVTYLEPMPDIRPEDIEKDYFKRYIFFHYNELKYLGKSNKKAAWTLDDA